MDFFALEKEEARVQEYRIWKIPFSSVTIVKK